MLDIVLVNELDRPVHVTVVEHSPLSIEIVLSAALVPIPVGTPLRRETLEPGQVLAIQGLHPNVNPVMTKKRLPDIKIKRTWGTIKKTTKFVMVTLLPAEGGSEDA